MQDMQKRRTIFQSAKFKERKFKNENLIDMQISLKINF